MCVVCVQLLIVYIFMLKPKIITHFEQKDGKNATGFSLSLADPFEVNNAQNTQSRIEPKKWFGCFNHHLWKEMT